MIFVNRLITRAINYAVTPVLVRFLDAVDSGWSNLDPPTRTRIIRTLTLIVLPLFYTVDALRAGLVRAYISNKAFSSAVLEHAQALSRIAFRTPSTSDAAPTSIAPTISASLRSSTRMPFLPLIVAGLPVFYAVDMTRSWIAGIAHPELDRATEGHIQAIWQYTFGSAWNRRF